MTKPDPFVEFYHNPNDSNAKKNLYLKLREMTDTEYRKTILKENPWIPQSRKDFMDIVNPYK